MSKVLIFEKQKKVESLWYDIFNTNERGCTIMNVSYLKKLFAEVKEYETDCVNKLMDFTKFLYIQGHLTVTEFRNSMKVLEANGAENPAYDIH
jgi:hypothetical protein